MPGTLAVECPELRLCEETDDLRRWRSGIFSLEWSWPMGGAGGGGDNVEDDVAVCLVSVVTVGSAELKAGSSSREDPLRDDDMDGSPVAMLVVDVVVEKGKGEESGEGGL